uniref:C2H2-type domain-containing protein n=1 Tax=Takifugu rubripes TaxID=31033 RepID=A0A674NCC1_TAKRU
MKYRQTDRQTISLISFMFNLFDMKAHYPLLSTIYKIHSMTMAFQKGDHHNLGFNFSSHKRNVDWRRINVLNIDLLVRTVDIDALQEYISDVTYCSLETVRCPQCMSPADPTLVKLFRLAQLSLEWLHHCQEKLISGLQNTEDKLKSSEEECQKLKDKNKEQEEKMKGMVSELKSRRTIIKKQQSLFATNINNGIQCGHCEKNYLNAFFLQKHMLRRHPDQCQNCKYFTRHIHVPLVWTLKTLVFTSFQ